MIRHPKRRGEWVEMQFMARAAAHGLTVSKPWGDSARYDFIVEAGGLCRRVQVKSTTFQSGKAYCCNTVSRNIKGLVGTYSAASIDFFVFYIIPEDIWYIVPVAELARAKWAVFLNPHDPKNRYFRYMEAWHLLKRGSARARRQPSQSARVDIQACAAVESPAGTAEPSPARQCREDARLNAQSPAGTPESSPARKCRVPIIMRCRVPQGRQSFTTSHAAPEFSPVPRRLRAADDVCSD